MLKQPSATASAIGKNILRRSQGKESAPIIAAGPYYSLVAPVCCSAGSTRR